MSRASSRTTGTSSRAASGSTCGRSASTITSTAARSSVSIIAEPLLARIEAPLALTRHQQQHAARHPTPAPGRRQSHSRAASYHAAPGRDPVKCSSAAQRRKASSRLRPGPRRRYVSKRLYHRTGSPGLRSHASPTGHLDEQKRRQIPARPHEEACRVSGVCTILRSARSSCSRPKVGCRVLASSTRPAAVAWEEQQF